MGHTMTGSIWVRAGFGATFELFLGRAALGDGYTVNQPLHDDHMDVDVARQIGYVFGDGIADRVGGQGGGDAGCTGAKTMLAAWDIHVSKRVGADGANHGGVVEHGYALVALGDHHRIDDMQDSAADGKIRHAMVMRILVGNGRDE